MFILTRAAVYASVFVGVLLIALPRRLLERAGVARPAEIGPAEIAGILLTATGAALAIACVLTFAVRGKGTPAPFDPPRRLVTAGPYRYVRNPMYLGAALALAGAALYLSSPALLAYTGGFLLIAHLFVIGYEEPVLRRRFGAAYDAYCRAVPRWRPAFRGTGPGAG